MRTFASVRIWIVLRGEEAVDNVEGRAVTAAANHDVVDAPAEFQRHLPGRDQRVGRGERVSWLAGVDRLPGIAVVHAGAREGLTSGPEPDAGRVWGVVEVAGEYHVPVAVAELLLDESRTGRGLQFALVPVADLPVGLVVHEQERPYRVRGDDLGNDGGRCPGGSGRRHAATDRQKRHTGHPTGIRRCPMGPDLSHRLRPIAVA
jgi:hypothetical protein